MHGNISRLIGYITFFGSIEAQNVLYTSASTTFHTNAQSVLLGNILIIDDIHELKNKSRTQAEFFLIFNELQNKNKQLVFTSDKPPKEIIGIEERIRTRLSSALLIDIQQPDLETRIAILKKKAIEKDIYLDDEVINPIASCVKTNVRELEGKLVKLGAYSDLMNVDIDLEIAKDQLNLSQEDIDREELTLDSIAKVVSNYYKIAMHII